tara:strand:- start:983 stop:2332 length:1350 start_codon:yes stop_codon:yes gene_type:complete
MVQLLQHQVEDATFLSSKPGVRGLFSGMGSGKTLTAIEALAQVRHVNEQYDGFGGDVVVIAPPITLTMWAEEIYEHTGLPTQIIRKGSDKIDADADVIILSYDLATKRAADLHWLTPSVLICDEAHALKNIKAKRTKAILGRGGLCEAAEFTWLLTGTPITRYNDDVYAFLLRAAGPESFRERLGGTGIDRFRLRHCVTQLKSFGRGRPTPVVVGNRNTEELSEWIFGGGFAVRRELQEVWDAMPDLTISHLEVGYTASASLKRELSKLSDLDLDDLEESLLSGDGHIATVRRQLGIAKVPASAKEIVDRVEAGNSPILVGAIHHDVIDALDVYFRSAGIVHGVIDGRTPNAHRDQFIDAFNAHDIDVLVGQISAMGVGVNLQGGHHIVEVETDWSPAIMDQFRARCHRMGQAKTVHVDVFNTDTNLDRAIRRIQATKRRDQATAMSAA